MMTVFHEMCYATHLVNKMHKNPSFFDEISFSFLNIGLDFYPSKLFVPTGESMRRETLLLPGGWQCIWEVINHFVMLRKS